MEVGTSNKLIFLHIPKAGGSTFHNVISRNYDNKVCFTTHPFLDNYKEESTECYLKHSLDEFNQLNEEKKNSIVMLKGHFLFGLHNLLTDKFEYITFVREPFSRVVSNYNYIKNLPSNVSKFKDVDFEIFLTRNMDISVKNLQTRMIAGVNLDVTVDKQDHLKLAIENIEKYFSVIGLTEYYDESLIVFKKIFGWQNIYYKKLNVSEARVINISAKAKKMCLEMNELDLALYEFCKNRFKKVLDDVNSLKLKRRIFRVKNFLYSKKLKEINW